MTWPEPSRSDHNAPWNLDETDEGWICSCTACQKARERDYDEERADDLYHARKEGIE